MSENRLRDLAFNYYHQTALELHDLELFAAQVAAIAAEIEREECAALALGEPDNWGVYEPHGEWIASAIRARGSK